MNYYILIASSADDKSGNIIEGNEVASKRLDKCIWPLYNKTQNRKRIMSGDICFIYVSGTGKNHQHIIGEVAVKSNNEIRNFVDDYYHPSTPSNVLHLTNCKKYKDPICFKSILTDLSICPSNMQRWGCALQGGCRKISEDDYKKILKVT